MPSSCKDIRKELIDCLLKSDCVQKHAIKPAKCLESENVNLVPSSCLILRRSYFDCRRGMIDMTKRFRGNGPITNSKTSSIPVSSGIESEEP